MDGYIDVFSHAEPREIPAVYGQLERELVEAGVPTGAVVEKKGLRVGIRGPVTVLINTNVSARPFVPILLKFAPLLLDLEKSNFIDGVLRALTERGLTGVAPFLLSLWDHDPPVQEHVLWVAGDALATINDKSADEDIIKLCRAQSGRSLQMLMAALARRRRPEALDVLIAKLKDPQLVGHAINALWKFGDPAALPFIQDVETRPGTLAHREKKKALERLKPE